MGSSLKLFTWLGIPVRMHWTFGLVFLFAFWMGYQNGAGVLGVGLLVLLFVFLSISVFGCVLLHEYGHSLMARRYGVQTQDIILTPIGGIARLERMPENPIQEFWVAIAGPAVNVLIALVLALLTWTFLDADEWTLYLDEFKSMVGSFYTELLGFSESSDTVEIQEEESPGLGLGMGMLAKELSKALIMVNVILVLFNLIPAFPMDGGRVLRALLSMRMGRVRATQIASWVGQAFAVFFVINGLWKGPATKVLIGIFVFTMARSENAMVQLENFTRKFRAKDLMRPIFTRLNSTDWMQSAVELLHQGLERHFLVFNLSDQLLGVLEEEAIVEAVKKRDLSAEVGEYTSSVEVVHVNETLQYIYYLIRNQREGMIAVADDNGLVGVIDEAGLDNFMRLNGITR